ncbi:MAG: hypothetical protein GY826_37380 [Fuerstiella sp.]|nr:hypothetical protein [Fuerstiella sp.]
MPLSSIVGGIMNELWYVRIGPGHTIGPATAPQLRELAALGRVTAVHEISADNQSWQSVGDTTWLTTAHDEFSTSSGGTQQAVDASDLPQPLQSVAQSPAATPSALADTDSTGSLGPLVSVTWSDAIAAWWGPDRTAAAISLIAHTAVTCILATIVFTAETPEDRLTINGAFDDENLGAEPLQFTAAEVELDTPAEATSSLDATVAAVESSSTLPESTVRIPSVPSGELLSKETGQQETSSGSPRRGTRDAAAVGAAIDAKVNRAGGSTQKLLRFSLSWNTRDDLDVAVQTPSGNSVWYKNRAADGGRLDVDANVQGETMTPVENVVWNNAPQRAGYYTARVQYYAAKTSQSGPVNFTLVTYVHGVPEVHKGRLNGPGHIVLVHRVRYSRMKDEE